MARKASFGVPCGKLQGIHDLLSLREAVRKGFKQALGSTARGMGFGSPIGDSPFGNWSPEGHQPVTEMQFGDAHAPSNLAYPFVLTWVWESRAKPRLSGF